MIADEGINQTDTQVTLEKTELLDVFFKEPDSAGAFEVVGDLAPCQDTGVSAKCLSIEIQCMYMYVCMHVGLRPSICWHSLMSCVCAFAKMNAGGLFQWYQCGQSNLPHSKKRPPSGVLRP